MISVRDSRFSVVLGAYHGILTGCSAVLFAAAAWLFPCSAISATITCGGNGSSHLQGVACDGEYIYWCYTTSLVKTDLSGAKVAETEVAGHSGDLCVHLGKVYIATEEGRYVRQSNFKQEVRVYDAATLRLAKKYNLDADCAAKNVHVSSIEYANGRFWLAMGQENDSTDEKNYVFEYTPSFELVAVHELATGNTQYGLQTIAFHGGKFYVGTYSGANVPASAFICDSDMQGFVPSSIPAAEGVMSVTGVLYTAVSSQKNDVWTAVATSVDDIDRLYSVNGSSGDLVDTPEQLLALGFLPKSRFYGGADATISGSGTEQNNLIANAIPVNGNVFTLDHGTGAYAGGVAVASGTLTVPNPEAINAPAHAAAEKAAPIVLSEGTLRFAAGGTLARDIALFPLAGYSKSAAVVDVASGVVTNTGSITSLDGHGNFIKTGAGTFVLATPSGGVVTNVVGSHGEHPAQWKNYISLPANGDGPSPTSSHHPAFAVLNGHFAIATSPKVVTVLGNGVFIGGPTTPDGVETAGHLDIYSGIVRCDGFFTLGRDNGNSVNAPDGLASSLNIYGGSFWCDTFDMSYYSFGADKTSTCRPVLNVYSGGTFETRDIFRIDYAGADATINVDGGKLTVGGAAFHSSYYAPGCRVTINVSNGGEFVCKSFMPVRMSSLEQPSYARVNVTSGGSITFRTVDSVDGHKGQDARFFFDGGTLKTDLNKAQGEIESYMPVDVGANGMTIDTTVGSYWGLKVNSSMQSAPGVTDGGLRIVSSDPEVDNRWVCLNGGVNLSGGVSVSNAYMLAGGDIHAAVTLEDAHACIRPTADVTIDSIAYAGNEGRYEIAFTGVAGDPGVRAYVVTANSFTPPKGRIVIYRWKGSSTTGSSPVGTNAFLRVPASSPVDASCFFYRDVMPAVWFIDSVENGWRTISIVDSGNSSIKRPAVDPRASDDWLSGSGGTWMLGPWLLEVTGDKASANFMQGDKGFNKAGGISVADSLERAGGGLITSGLFVKLGDGTLTFAGDKAYTFATSMGNITPQADGSNWNLFDANGNATDNGYKVPIIVGAGTLAVGKGSDSPSIIIPVDAPLWIGCPTTTAAGGETDAAMVVNSGYVKVGTDIFVGRNRPASTAAHEPLLSSYVQNGGEVDANKVFVGYSDSSYAPLQQIFSFTLNGGRFSTMDESRVGTFYGTSDSRGNLATMTINGGLFESGKGGSGALQIGQYISSANSTATFEITGGEVRAYAGVTCSSAKSDDSHHAQVLLNGGTLAFGGSSKPTFSGSAKSDLRWNGTVLKPLRASHLESASAFENFAVREIGANGAIIDLSEANIDCFDITTDFTGSGSITVRGGDTNRSLRICYNLSSTGEYIAEDGGVIHIWHQSGSYFGKYKTVRVKNGGGVSSYYSQEIKNVYLGETVADSTFVYGYGFGGESPLVAGTTLQINGTVYCAFRRVGDGNPLRVPKKDSPLPILRGPKGSFAGVDIATQFKLHPLLAKDGVTATFALDTSSSNYDQVTIAVSETVYYAPDRLVQVDHPGTTTLDGTTPISGTKSPLTPFGILSADPTSGGGTIEVTGPLSGNGTIKLTTGRIEGRPEDFDGMTLDLNNASVRFTESGTSTVNLRHLANDNTGMGVEVADGKTVYVTGLLSNNSALVKMDTGTLVIQNEAPFTLAGNNQKNAMTDWNALNVPVNGDIYNINALTVNAGTLAFNTPGTVVVTNGASRFSGTSGERGLGYTCDGPCVGSHPIPDGEGGALPAVMELWSGEIVNPAGALCVGVYTSSSTYDNCSKFTTRPYAAFNLRGGIVRVKSLAMGYAAYYQCGKYELNIHDGLFEIGDGHAIVGCEGSEVRINGEDNECVVNVYGGELRKLAGSRFLLGSKLTGWKTYVPMMKLNVYGGMVRADESVQLEVPGGNGCKGFLGLYGGVFEVGNVTNRSTNARTAGYVHFDGGTFRPLENGGTLNRFTAVTVGAGGGTIDMTNGNTYTVMQLARASDLGGAADGGFGASGDGMLFMNVANGYTGPTRVSGSATFMQGVANAFSDTVELDGGTLDLNGFATTFRTVKGHGTIIGDCTVTEGLEIEGPLNFSGNLTLGNGVTVRMEVEDDGTMADSLNVSGTLAGSNVTFDFGRYDDRAFVAAVQTQIGTVGGGAFRAQATHVTTGNMLAGVRAINGQIVIDVHPRGVMVIMR